MEDSISTIDESELCSLPKSIKMDGNSTYKISVGKINKEISTEKSMKENRKIENDNSSTTETISHWNALYALVVLGVSMFGLSLLILLPRQNMVFYPSYWYETATIYLFLIPLTWTLDQAMSCLIYTNNLSCISFRIFLIYNLVVLIAFVGTYGLCYYIWVDYFQFNPPMPNLFVNLLFTTWIASLVALCYLHPSEQRSNMIVRKKLRVYYLYSIWFSLILGAIQIECISELYSSLIPEQLEWTMAIVVPACRKMNHRILLRFVAKMDETDKEMANVLLTSTLSTYFTTFISVRLASANTITVYCVLLVELFLHLIMSIRVVRLQTRVQSDETQAVILTKVIKSFVLDIVLVEAIEAIIPILYAVGLEMIFRGPNKSLFADSFATALQLQENYNDDDITHLFDVLFQMIGIDLVSIVISGLLLWKFGKINMINEFCYLMKNYWFILTIKVLRDIIIHFAGNDLNMGSPWSGTEWISNEGRIQMILNSTYLTDTEKSLLNTY